MSSSAKHSAIVLMFLNEVSLAPVHNNQMAWFTLRNGDTSTACRLTVPARPILVESSRGPLLMMAFTNTCKGFCKRLICLVKEEKHEQVVSLYSIRS